MQQMSNNVLFGILIAVGVGFLLSLLSPILTPFLLGAFFAYLADPAVKKLETLRLPRILSVVIVFFFMFVILSLLILLIIPPIQKQINALILMIPDMLAWLQTTAWPWLTTRLDIDIGTIDVSDIKSLVTDNLSQAGGLAHVALKTLLHSGSALLSWLGICLLVPIVTFYLLCDWQGFLRGVQNLLPRDYAATIIKLAAESESVLGAFVKGQLLVIFADSIYYSCGLTLAGLRFGLIIGIITAVMSLVPYLGFIVGIVIASIAALIQFDSYTPLLLVWGVFLLGHVLENFILVPYLIGNRIGLHPVTVIFAVLAGGCLFGFMGVLLALPIAAVLMVWVRHIYTSLRGNQQFYFR